MGNLRAVLHFAFLGFQSFQDLPETRVYTYKPSAATTCSYTAVSRRRRGKEPAGTEREEPLSESPQSPWDENGLLNSAKERGKEKENGLRPPHPALLLSVKKKKGKGRRRPNPFALHPG